MDESRMVLFDCVGTLLAKTGVAAREVRHWPSACPSTGKFAVYSRPLKGVNLCQLRPIMRFGAMLHHMAAHARRAGPPQLPPHLQLHASLQHPLYSSGEAAGHGGAQQLVPGHPPLPPHLAASKSRQQQQQQPAQVPHGIQQQHPLKSAAAPDQQHHRLQLDRSSAAPQPNGKKRVSRRHRAREFRQREQQLLNGGDSAEQMNIEQWPQHDSAVAPHSVPGLMEVSSWSCLPAP